ncbi:MAG: hypothetical protein V7L01_21365 [Nostoc sp.]
MLNVEEVVVAYEYSGEIVKEALAGIDFFDNLPTSKKNNKTIKRI